MGGFFGAAGGSGVEGSVVGLMTDWLSRSVTGRLKGSLRLPSYHGKLGYFILLAYRLHYICSFQKRFSEDLGGRAAIGFLYFYGRADSYLDGNDLRLSA